MGAMEDLEYKRMIQSQRRIRQISNRQAWNQSPSEYQRGQQVQDGVDELDDPGVSPKEVVLIHETEPIDNLEEGIRSRVEIHIPATTNAAGNKVGMDKVAEHILMALEALKSTLDDDGQRKVTVLQDAIMQRSVKKGMLGIALVIADVILAFGMYQLGVHGAMIFGLFVCILALLGYFTWRDMWHVLKQALQHVQEKCCDYYKLIYKTFFGSPPHADLKIE